MGWSQLGAIYAGNAREYEHEQTRTPVECPVDKYPLEQGPVEGQLHCKFGGELYDLSGRPIFG